MNQFKPVLQSRQQTLRAYCPNIYTVSPGHNALKDWEKWTVSRESWDEPLYPKCCYGPAYVLSPRAVIGIVKAYEKTLVHFSKFEDIYITGKIFKWCH
jgi:hypothetical protein